MNILEKIDAALVRIKSGQGLMRVPAEETDPDLVLYECYLLLSASRVDAVSAPVMAQSVSDLETRIREATALKEHWYIFNADESGYCMDSDNGYELQRWLDDRNRESPEYIKRNGYHLVKRMVRGDIEQMALDALELLLASQRAAAQPTAPVAAKILAEHDAMLYGTGFYRLYADGTTEHIPAQQVIIQVAPVAAVTDALSQDVIDHCWKMYRDGQIAVEPKESFGQVLQSLLNWSRPAARSDGDADWYFAQCDDPDRAYLYDNKSDAESQCSEYGGTVLPLYECKPAAHSVSSIPSAWAPDRLWLQRENGDHGSHTWCDSSQEDNHEQAEYVRVGAQAEGPAITADVHRDAEQLQIFANAVKTGIADYYADNAAMQNHSHAEVDAFIRSVEIRADLVWACIAARAGEAKS